MNNMRKIREKNKLSQTEVANKLGVSQQTVAKWESGDMLPRANKLINLSKLLKCKINELLENDLQERNG